MKDVADYLAYIKALIAMNPQVAHWVVVREESQGNRGLFRYQLTLRDGCLLEMFESFQVVEEKLQVAKYSFHWQAKDGKLKMRWDNARHPPELKTFPHHTHVGEDGNVKASTGIDIKGVLRIMESEVKEGLG